MAPTAAQKVISGNEVIWGNKSIENQARQLPPSRGPIATDPEWNQFVDLVQDPTLGHVHDGTIGAKIPFTNLVPGDTLTAGDYEIDTGRFIAGNKSLTSGFWLRSAVVGLKRAITFSDVGSLHIVNLGDSTVALLLQALYVDGGVIPWRNFDLDTQVNVTTTSEGVMRRHSIARVPQFVSSGVYRSMELLWQNGIFTGDGTTTAFSVTFTNAQADAAYRVYVEPDGVLGTPISWRLVGSKTNTSFTVNFVSAPPLGDTYNWYALRYGV